MLTTSQPIFVEKETSSARSNTYLPYRMRLMPSFWDSVNSVYSTSYNRPVLYEGKAFVLPSDVDHGKINVEISQQMNDHRWSWKTAWDSNAQKYTPVFSTVLDPVHIGDEPMLDLQPIEFSENKLYNCYNYIEFGNNLYTWSREMTPAYTLPQIGVHNIVHMSDPYFSSDDDGYGFFHWNALYMQDGQEIRPRLPYINTTEYWFGFQFGIGQRARLEDITYSIYGTRKGLSLKNIDAGNYSMCITLSDLFTYVEGLGTSKQLKVVEHNDPDKDREFAIADIDVDCSADYYISWITPWQTWQSQPFFARTTMKETIDNRIITDPFERDRVISLRNRPQFTVNSGIVSDRMYNLLCTIMMSPVVYLYDTLRDRGYYVTCTNKTASTMRGNRSLQLNLEAIRENIL